VALVGLVFFGVLGRDPVPAAYSTAFEVSLVCLAVLALLLAAVVWRLTAGSTGR